MRGICGKSYIKAFYVLFVIGALGGCAQYHLVGKGKRISVGNVFMVDTLIDWSKQETGNIEGWTVDGPQLQRLVFIKGIPDGKPLIELNRRKGESALCFGSSMSSVEIMDLFLATLTRTGARHLKTSDLRPCRFGALDGFRFEYRYETVEGVKYKGLTAGAQKEGRLFALMYVGTALYHFEKHHREVERIIASLSVLE